MKRPQMWWMGIALTLALLTPSAGRALTLHDPRTARPAPRGVVVQLAKKNGNGCWHCRRHACLSAENW